jgi:predicted phosphate transport protein (TIGR00153 family)
MFRRLLPKKDVFFTHMETSAAKAVEIAGAYRDLVRNPSEVAQRVAQISEIEKAADEHLHQVLLELQRTFITPLDRNEISTICRRLDDIIDLVEGAAQRMLHYELHTTTPPLDALVDVLLELTEIVRKAVASLDNLRQPEGLRASLIQIHTLENKADAILRPAIGDLFRMHADARDIIKWKEVYEHLETATDRCEDVADQLENILLEYA